MIVAKCMTKWLTAFFQDRSKLTKPFAAFNNTHILQNALRTPDALTGIKLNACLMMTCNSPVLGFCFRPLVVLCSTYSSDNSSSDVSVSIISDFHFYNDQNIHLYRQRCDIILVQARNWVYNVADYTAPFSPPLTVSVVGSVLAEQLHLSNSVPMYLSIYVCPQNLLLRLEGRRLGRFQWNFTGRTIQ